MLHVLAFNLTLFFKLHFAWNWFFECFRLVLFAGWFSDGFWGRNQGCCRHSEDFWKFSLLLPFSHDLGFKNRVFKTKVKISCSRWKLSIKHNYKPPSGLLKTIRLLTHDLEMTLTETLDLDLEFQDKNETSVTQVFSNGMTWFQQSQEGNKTSSSISVMACLTGCKTDADETPTYAYAKSCLITDGGLKTDTNTIHSEIDLIFIFRN